MLSIRNEIRKIMADRRKSNIPSKRDKTIIDKILCEMKNQFNKTEKNDESHYIKEEVVISSPSNSLGVNKLKTEEADTGASALICIVNKAEDPDEENKNKVLKEKDVEKAETLNGNSKILSLPDNENNITQKECRRSPRNKITEQLNKSSKNSILHLEEEDNKTNRSSEKASDRLDLHQLGKTNVVSPSDCEWNEETQSKRYKTNGYPKKAKRIRLESSLIKEEIKLKNKHNLRRSNRLTSR